MHSSIIDNEEENVEWSQHVRLVLELSSLGADLIMTRLVTINATSSSHNNTKQRTTQGMRLPFRARRQLDTRTKLSGTIQIKTLGPDLLELRISSS